MTKENLAELKSKVENATKGFSKLTSTSKKMFGCDGYFANGNIFSL